jgi:urease accessory protein
VIKRSDDHVRASHLHNPQRGTEMKPSFGPLSEESVGEALGNETGRGVSAMSPERGDRVRLQRSRGAGRIVLAGSATGTRLVSEYQKFPVRIMFPTIGGRSANEAVIVNSSGGVAGGDQFEFEVTAIDHAEAVVTSQAAEKIYRAISEPALVTTTLRASGNSKLAWIPQETIVFDQARICRRTEVEISSGSEVMALEWLVLGHAAHGEDVRGGLISDSWRVKRDGKLVWADAFYVEGDMFAQLHRKALLAGHRAVATLMYCGPSLDERLQFMRDVASSLECECAATTVGGLIIVRAAAATSFELRTGLLGLIRQFSEKLAPGPFGVPKMWSC